MVATTCSPTRSGSSSRGFRVFAAAARSRPPRRSRGADLDTLQSLVEKSLVRRTGDRFWMLETIREYAAERLAALPDEEELVQLHAEFFYALARAVEVGEKGVDQDEWWNRLEAELSNVRSASSTIELEARPNASSN